jgi:hypothetical protein
MNTTRKAWDILTTLKNRDEKPFTVVYSYTDTESGVAVKVTRGYDTELDAVQCLTQVELYVNLEPVSYSANIDRNRFRY